MEPNVNCGCGRAYCDWPIGKCPREPTGPLRRKIEASGPRDFLVGKPVHCGQPLDLLVTHEFVATRASWVRVRYETATRRSDTHPRGERVAIFIDDTGEHDVTERHVFRWPLPGAASDDLFHRGDE